jgi:hypothetical protein
VLRAARHGTAVPANEALLALRAAIDESSAE